MIANAVVTTCRVFARQYQGDKDFYKYLFSFIQFFRSEVQNLAKTNSQHVRDVVETGYILLRIFARMIFGI